MSVLKVVCGVPPAGALQEALPPKQQNESLEAGPTGAHQAGHAGSTGKASPSLPRGVGCAHNKANNKSPLRGHVPRSDLGLLVTSPAKSLSERPPKNNGSAIVRGSMPPLGTPRATQEKAHEERGGGGRTRVGGGQTEVTPGPLPFPSRARARLADKPGGFRIAPNHTSTLACRLGFLFEFEATIDWRTSLSYEGDGPGRRHQTRQNCLASPGHPPTSRRSSALLLLFAGGRHVFLGIHSQTGSTGHYLCSQVGARPPPSLLSPYSTPPPPHPYPPPTHLPTPPSPHSSPPTGVRLATKGGKGGGGRGRSGHGQP